MTLQEVIEHIVYNNPEKQRIIREPNNRGWCDVYFTYDKERKKLISNVYQTTGFIRKPAPFQTSTHTDWILV